MLIAWKRCAWPVVLAAALAPFARVHAQPHGGGHGFHVPMPDQQLVLQCRVEGGDAPGVEHVLRPRTLMAAAELSEELRVPPLAQPLRLVQYLPQAERVQQVLPAESGAGPPAVRVQITGRTQSFERWLIADNPERNRLSSLIATWRYMSVADAGQRDVLLQQFREELTRPPQVLIAGAGDAPPMALTARAGESCVWGTDGTRVAVRAFMPHFGLDTETKEPVNQSDKRVNPAVLVEITRNDRTEAHWLFAKFPEFETHGGAATPLRMRLDCPIELTRPAPDVVLVTIDRNRHEAWVRHEGKVTDRALGLNEPIEVPGSNYVFAIVECVPAGRLVETFRATEARSAVTALRVDVAGADGAYAPVWLELGKPRQVETAAGPLVLTFAARATTAPRGG